VRRGRRKEGREERELLIRGILATTRRPKKRRIHRHAIY
jgi:hypothetical protein